MKVLRTVKCPKKLEELINDVRALPLSKSLRLPENEDFSYSRPHDEGSARVLCREKRAFLYSACQGLGEEFSRFVWSNYFFSEELDFEPKTDPKREEWPTDDHDIDDLIRRTDQAFDNYVAFDEWQKNFIELIELVVGHTSWELQFEKQKRQQRTAQHREFDRRRQSLIFNSPDVRARLRDSPLVGLTMKGKLVREGGRFLEAISEPGVELQLIRSCLACDRVFWAGRNDSFCCTKKCLSKVKRAAQPKPSEEVLRKRAHRKAETRRQRKLDQLLPVYQEYIGKDLPTKAIDCYTLSVPRAVVKVHYGTWVKVTDVVEVDDTEKPIRFLIRRKDMPHDLYVDLDLRKNGYTKIFDIAP